MGAVVSPLWLPVLFCFCFSLAAVIALSLLRCPRLLDIPAGAGGCSSSRCRWCSRRSQRLHWNSAHLCCWGPPSRVFPFFAFRYPVSLWVFALFLRAVFPLFLAAHAFRYLIWHWMVASSSGSLIGAGIEQSIAGVARSPFSDPQGVSFTVPPPLMTPQLCSTCGGDRSSNWPPRDCRPARPRPGRQSSRSPGWRRKLRELEIWVAELDGVAAAWGAIRGDVLEGLYAAPEFAGRGVASGMLARLEALMIERGVAAVHAEASSNAQGFLSSPGLPDQRTANGRWRVADHQRASIDACRRLELKFWLRFRQAH